MKKIKKILCLVLVCVMIIGIIPVTGVQAAPKFNVSTSSMKKQIVGCYMTYWHTELDSQTFVIKKSEIKKFNVISKKQKGNVVKVSAAVYVDRKVAEVKAKMVLTYLYKNGKWRCTSVDSMPAQLSKINLKGTWKGTYVANQGETKAVVKINKVSKDGFIQSGTFNFSAVPSNPRVPSGKYYLKGGYSLGTGKVALYGKEWIKQPYNYNMIDVDMHVNVQKKALTGNYSMVLKKQ